MFWIRAATLQIGSKKYNMNGLNFDFEIPFEDSTTLQTATVNIYNLSKSTRSNIRRGDAVIINAGYEEDVGSIFVGQVSSCSHTHQKTDWITKLTATAAMKEWLSRKVNKTYNKGITAAEIIRDLLNIFGIEVGQLELSENKVYTRGRVCSGKVKDILIQIVVNECKSRFLIRNGNIIISNPNTGINNGYVLSPESGLLNTSNEAEETVIAVGTDSQLSQTEKDEKGTYISRACLLNYHIGPADVIQIKSKDLNGKFLVAGGKHTGNPKGEWKTELQLKPL